ncbi:MAG: hypothetical protein J6Q65_05415, partial [Lentisphaeria bacterium]|nr:hypothetical protein [Lentisphaeria bacterium]
WRLYILPPVLFAYHLPDLRGIFLLALLPWFWCLVPALGVVEQMLAPDRTSGEWKYLRLCNVLAVALVIGAFPFGVLPCCPVFAILLARVFLSAKNAVCGKILQISRVALTWILPLPVLIASLLSVRPLYERNGGMEQDLLNYLYYRIPLAALLLLLIPLLMRLFRRKKEVLFAPEYPALDVLIPAIYGAFLVVIP